ncbi:EF-hand domain-containing protein [Acidaminobacter sp. JC074]|uniref:EF-hand domain-containing protein n=1 Tax=Acidaminobacter sp. JC074 TaxID=2530199 RepID=UPI001F0E11E9|nr:EF-hand domain-containing protein [Acidaminobacter sp. JC074]MCH4888032.1 EF-hand domain-containing protein [Acidaminobacter sp. JC074]
MTSISSYSNVYMQPRPNPPKVDTNNDQSLDLEELESFSKKVSDKQGTSFDAAEVMAKYDTDQDGLISKAEGSSLKEDNAFNLESPQDAQMKMMSSRPPRPQGGGQGNMNVTSTSDLASTMLEALEEDETDDSDLTSQLLKALDSSATSTYSAAEIAEYDTNGDGQIDSIEEALMKLTSEDSSNSALFEKALSAYQDQLSDMSDPSDFNTFTI